MNRDDTWILAERAKELECMYAVDEVLQNKQLAIPAAMEQLVRILPGGFTYPQVCRIQITLNENTYQLQDFPIARQAHESTILIDNWPIGSIKVGYLPGEIEGEEPALLDSEIKMLNAVAGRISLLVLNSQRELAIVFDMLQRVNPQMLARIGEHLYFYLKDHFDNHKDAFNAFLKDTSWEEVQTYGEVNTPLPKKDAQDALELSKKLISKATSFLPSAEVYELVNGWVHEDRVFSLVKTVGDKDAAVSDILEAIKSYTQVVGKHVNSPTETWLIIELAHRFLTTDENLLHLIQDNLVIEDFELIMEHIIGTAKSDGNIGGKSAGLFIAQQILKHAAKTEPLLADIKTPRSWFLAADQFSEFLRYNHMDEMHAYKYNSISHLRITYDNVVSKIKNGRLSPHIIQMLSLLLDDLGETPIIVRSSSLLEDRVNAVFSGKYKSLFLPNQGPKQQRLEDLIDAILEVYSSQYNPDSIQYRIGRKLLHYPERMGILIQEVVGRKVGPYYMPMFAGVAFSQNPLRWAPRVTREGGLVRMVMGLGTRAVDRVNDDYPVLFSPGQPGLRVNQNPADIKHYAPKYIDLINLDEKRFETVYAEEFLKEWGNEMPGLNKLVSVYHPEYMQVKNAFELSPQRDDMVITFEGILANTDLPATINRMLAVLSEKMRVPVDIEFAYDGQNLVLLQCRPMGRGSENEAAPIPKNLPAKDVLFTANRFINDGRLEGIRYIVYVDAEGYSNLESREELLAVGKAVGQLNDILPNRKYILMGPGRWGSRGDIQLGVRVTYADICNTAAMIEIAREKHSYVPELSFGTHFFQDLVESNIAYLPLYPDQPGNVFKHTFFENADNLLEKLLPQYAHLSNALRVIDLAQSGYGKQLFLYMNAQLEKAVGFLSGAENVPSEAEASYEKCADVDWNEGGKDRHWRWRQYMAEQIAREIDAQALGVAGMYLFGSTDDQTAGMGSDIDLLVHFVGDEGQKTKLLLWLDGWSKALAKINFLRTGYEADSLLDVHLITDEDIRKKDSYAIKINSITDPASVLPMGAV